MAIKTDFHLHSAFSGDAETPMEQMIQKGIELGMNTLCFTEHMDYQLISEGIDFAVDTAAYHNIFVQLKEKYQNKIELLFGIELGLEPQHHAFLTEYTHTWDFDFIIGSSHVIDGIDSYYPVFFEGRSEEASYHRYFETILENLTAFSDIDVYGHLDYIVRYGPNKSRFYSYEKYRDVIDAALKTMVEKQIGLEVNSAGFRKGLGFPNPHPDIIRRYLALGGEIISVGSDAHDAESIAADFETVRKLLLACGCRYYTIFRKRKPEFIHL